MKLSLHTISLLTIALFLLAGCASNNKEEEKKENMRVLTQTVADEKGVQRMQVSKAEQNVKHGNATYHFTIVRQPDESLDRVKSENGDMFVDNEITLTVSKDGKQLFKEKFTKQSFVNITGSSFLKKSVLEGMVFDRTTPQGLVFATSVCYPQTDLFFPISVTIAANGKMSMAKEEIDEISFKE